jgi:hypothetical protein
MNFSKRMIFLERISQQWRQVTKVLLGGKSQQD